MPPAQSWKYTEKTEPQMSHSAWRFFTVQLWYIRPCWDCVYLLYSAFFFTIEKIISAKWETTLLCAFQVHLNSAKAMFILSNEEMKATSQSKEVLANPIVIFRTDSRQISKKGFAFAFATVHREQALRSIYSEREIFDLCCCPIWTLNSILCEVIWNRYRFRSRWAWTGPV